MTAAAAIMVCVFLSFMLGEDRVIKEFGLSLASAVFLDALVIRCLLLPATLHLLGRPDLADPAAGSTGVLPHLNIEGTLHAPPRPRTARRRAPAARRRPERRRGERRRHEGAEA